MCKTCNNLRTLNDIDGIISFMEQDGVDTACYKACDVYLGSIDLTDQWEDCNLAVARELGQPEPELYPNDPHVYLTTAPDSDTVAQVIELQLRMDTGMSLIQELTRTRDALRVEYYTTKDRITKGGDMLKAWKAEGNSYKAWPHHGHMTALYKHRNKVGAELGATNDKLSTYWDHWKALKSQCQLLIKGDKAVWAKYFSIGDPKTDTDEFKAWLNRHLADEYQPGDRDHLQANPDVDNRMLESHEAYSLAHQEEQKELFSYNS